MVAERMNDSVLGVLERPALAWITGRLPSWIVPNHLTALGVLGALVTATGFILSRWWFAWIWLASAGLIINWLGDSLDGTLARARRIERHRFGFFVDHTSDMFSQAVIFLSLGVSPCVHFSVACLGLIAFLMAFIYTLIGNHVRNVMRITYFGFGPTEIRALLLLGNVLTLAFGILQLQPPFLPARLGPITGHDLVISLLAFGSIVAIALVALREARALARLDPPPATKARK
jgi:archaetidylinositol phosphate synthase